MRRSIPAPGQLRSSRNRCTAVSDALPATSAAAIQVDRE